MEGLEQTEALKQEINEPLPEWLSSDGSRMQGQYQNLQTDMHRVELLLIQMAHQGQQERLEIRQDLIFICQYLKSLAERQDQQWQQIHCHRDEIINETRHHFQTLSSLLINPANSQAYATPIVPLQENQLTVPGIPNGNVLMPNQQVGGISRLNNVDEQRAFSFGTQDLTTSITMNLKASPREPLRGEQSQVMPEYKGNEQDMQSCQNQNLAGHHPDHQTFEQNSGHHYGHSEVLEINNRLQAVSELDVRLLNIIKQGEEQHMKPNYINSEMNEVEHKLQPRHVDEHKLQPRHVEEHKLQPRHVDEHKLQPRNVDEHKLQPRYVDEHKVQTMHVDKRKVQARHVNEHKMQARGADEYKVHEMHIDEYNIQARHVNEHKVQMMHASEKKVHADHVDEQSIHTGHVDEQNVKLQVENEQNCRSQLLMQPENVMGDTNGLKEQLKSVDQKLSIKKYADAVAAGHTPSPILKCNSSSEENDMPLPFFGASNVPEKEESFKAAGFYVEAISKLYHNNAQSPANSVKSMGSSNGQTYHKGQSKKYYKSGPSNSKVFTKSSKNT